MDKKKMKIGIVCPYSFDFPGGVMQHIVDFSSIMIKKGYDVKILAPGTVKKNTPKHITLIGKAIPIPVNGSVARIKFGPKVSNDIIAWLTINDFDILHVHEPTNPSISIFALLYAECPVVATFHAYYKQTLLKKIVGISLKTLLKKIEIPIAVSQNAKQTVMENFGINPIIVPNGINVSDYSKKSIKERNDNTILFLGRVNEKRKGLTFLLKSFEYILKNDKNLKLIIAGSGELSMKQIGIIENHRNNIEYIGKISENKKRKLFQTSSVYVAPQLFGESFGIVLLESFASKIPVVASAIPAFIDVSNGGQMAKLFAVSDKKHFARQVINVIKDSDDTKKMINESYKYVKSYDWQVISKKIETLYKSIA